MSLLEIMRARRSVRKYTDEEVTEEQLTAILQAGLLGPSGKGKCPQEFIVVRDKETLTKLADCRNGGSDMLKGANLAIIVVADTEISTTWIEDASVAMTSMHLMADSLGVGSCWIQGRGREAKNGQTTEQYIRDLLGFPEKYSLEAILSVGMPEKHNPARELDQLNMTKVHMDRF